MQIQTSPRLTAHALTYSLANGRVIFDNLEFSFAQERCGLVGANGSGKTTLLKILTGQLLPTSGQLQRELPKGDILYFAQDVTAQLQQTIADLLGLREKLGAFAVIESSESDAEAQMKAAEIIGDDWMIRERYSEVLERFGLNHRHLETPLTELSAGERVRVRLARVEIEKPSLLIMDEPTNHLDRDGRAFLREKLIAYNKTLIVVSHDRELLRSMDAIYELSSRGLKRYGGNFDFYFEQRAIEQAAEEQAIENARSELHERERMARLAQDRQAKRVRHANKYADTGMPRIIRGLLKRRAEETTAKVKGLHGDRTSEAREHLTAARSKSTKVDQLQIDLPLGGASHSKHLVEASELNFRFQNGDALWIKPVNFSLRSGERIAVSGRNGSGKTTLLRTIGGKMTAVEQTGFLRVASSSVAYLDQDLPIMAQDKSLLEIFTDQTPHLTVDERRVKLARFLFTNDRVFTSCRALSGGEKMRAALALVFNQPTPPDLLILDEPTNDLDLVSLTQLEDALQEVDCAMIVVSHDHEFLERIGINEILALPASSNKTS